MSFSKLKLCLVCVVLGGSVAALDSTGILSAAEKPKLTSRNRRDALDVAREFHNETETESEEDPTVRLLYLNAKWESVLKNVATAMDKTLVADRVPSGYYSRRDPRKHSPETALKILNRDLAKRHFRLVIKGDFLVLLDKNSMRRKYRAETLDESEEYEDEVVSQSARNNKIRRTGHETTEPSAPPEAIATPVEKIEPASQVAAEPEIASVAVKPGRRSAVDLARVIYRGFKPASRLIDAGPSGLPGFIVTHRVTQNVGSKGEPITTPLKLAVGIDAQKNELIVEGPQTQVESLLDLVDALDALKLRRGETIRLVAGESDAQQLENSLQPAIRRLQKLQFAQADPGQDPQAQPTQQPQPQEDDENVQEGLPALVGGIKGEVRVESVPEMGIIIIQGGQTDTEAVMKIIEEIQRLGQGAAPDIQVLNLRHVRSQALADLLTELYEKLLSGRSDSARKLQPAVVLPVVTPNAVVILAPEADMQTILKLAEELDQPVAPDTQFRMFRLKSAVASQVVEIVNDFYADRGGLSPQVKITSDARTNAVFLHAGPRDMEEIGSLIDEIDREDSASVNQMRLFRLQYASAEELAETLGLAIQSVLNPQAISGGGQGQRSPIGGGQGGGDQAQEIRGIRSTILQYLKRDGDRQEIIRSGILSDIRVTSEPRTNTLMVVAPEASMAMMEALIEKFDQPSPAVADIKVFKILNADASSIVQILETLFQTAGDENELGVQVAGAEGSDSNLIPLQFTADPRTNFVIARGGTEALRVAEAVILRLDADRIRERETIVYRLKNKRSDDVSAAINQFLEERRIVEEASTELGSLVTQVEREVIVVSEPMSNSLIISATPSYFEDIQNLVLQLDAQPEEVIIQALLVEVELENTDEFGVELGFQDSILFDRSIISPEDITTILETNATPGTGVVTETQRIISQASTPGFNFNNQPLGNNTINPASVGSQGLSNFAVGRSNAELGFGGLVLSASSESVSMLIRALSEVRNVEILSRPQIRTLDNLTAEIQVGQDVPIVTGFQQTTQTSFNPVVTPIRAGIILSVKPRITPDGKVVMEVIAEKSFYDLSPGAGVPIFTDATNGDVIESPVKDVTTASAVVSAKSGQTIVLGGMITKESAHIERKVPVLGDLPLLGHAFRYDFDQNRRSELLIFLTPRIIHDDAASECIKQVESERIHFFVEEAEAVHGPIYALPEDYQDCPPEMPAIEGQPSQQIQPILPPPEAIDEDGVPTTQMPVRTEQAGLESETYVDPQLLQLDQEFSESYDR